MKYKVFTLLLLIHLPLTATATERPEEVAKQAQIIERLNSDITVEIEFKNQDGEIRRLGDLLQKDRPLIIAPVYYECPRLCTLTQEGVVQSLKELDLKLGSDFRLVSVSFDHKEPVALARAKADRYHELLKNTDHDTAGWEFLIGDKTNIDLLMKEIGFPFTEDKGEFIHSAALIVITPEARISRYLYGIKFPAQTLRLALVEAARGKIGSTVDRVLMYCFRYDHVQGKYTLAIWDMTRILCSIFFLLLFGFLIRLRLQERRGKADVESVHNNARTSG